MCEMTSIGEMSPAMMQIPFLPCRIPLHTCVVAGHTRCMPTACGNSGNRSETEKCWAAREQTSCHFVCNTRHGTHEI